LRNKCQKKRRIHALKKEKERGELCLMQAGEEEASAWGGEQEKKTKSSSQGTGRKRERRRKTDQEGKIASLQGGAYCLRDGFRRAGEGKFL